MTKTMKDSGIEWIGEIPEDWSITRIKSCIAKRDSGAWGEEANNSEGDCICLRIADFDYNKFRFSDSDDLTIRHYPLNVIEKLKLEKNDILIEKSGGGEKTPVGRTVLFDKTYTALYANFMDRLRCSNIVKPLYMQYVFVTFYKNEYTRNYIKQTTGIQNLDLTSMLSKELMPLPSTSEQQKIADFLDEKCSHIDSILEKTKASINECKQLKQSVITQAVTKGIRPNRPMKDSGIEWIGKIPEDWEVVRMKSCIAKRDGGAWGEEANNSEGDCICLRIADFDYNKFRFSDSDNLTIRHYPLNVIEKLKLEKNDILIEKSGGGEKTPVGRTVLFDKTYTALYANFMDRLRCSNIVKPLYMQYVFVTFYKNEYTRNYIKQTTGIQNLDLTSMLSKELMPLPSTSEQQKIADFLDKKCSEIDKLITKKEKLIEELETYKKSLIYEYVTGKKEVV